MLSFRCEGWKKKSPTLSDRTSLFFQLYFDNNARTGKIRHRLNSEAHFHPCQSGIIQENSTSTTIRRDLLTSFDCFILVICLVSTGLCVRSLWRGHRLGREIRRFYAVERPTEKPFTWTELQTFYSFWYLLMILTDLLVMCGTIIKINILFKMRNDYNAAGLLLGLSSLFSWFGILRYLSFFRKYNVRRRELFREEKFSPHFCLASVCHHSTSISITSSISSLCIDTLLWICFLRMDCSRTVSYEISNISLDVRYTFCID